MTFFSKLLKFLPIKKQTLYDRVTGIDISDQTIEFVELVSSAKYGVRGLGSGKITIEPGIVTRGRIIDAPKLQVAIRKVFNEAVPKPTVPEHIVLGLPESQIYTHTFNIKKEDSSQLDSLIKKEAQSYIPLELNDMVISHRVLYEDRKNIEILIAVTSRVVIEEWQLFFESLEMKVDLFGIEHLATFRGMFNKPLDAPVCVIDMGSLTSHISIFDLHGLRYAYTMKVSGKTLTEELARGLSKTNEEAEEIKKTVGLSDSDKKVSDILKKTLRPIFSDTKRNFEYFEQKMGTKIETIVLVGGSSALPGLVDFINSEFGLKTRLGKQVIIQGKVSPRYIEAIGLAYRLMDEKWEKKDPAFVPLVIKAIEEEKPKKERSPWLQKIIGRLTGGHTKLAPNSSLITQTVSEEVSGESEEERAIALKLKRQKSMLVGILVLGLVSIPASFWYKSVQDAAKEAERKANLDALDSIETTKATGTIKTTEVIEIVETIVATGTTETIEAASSTESVEATETSTATSSVEAVETTETIEDTSTSETTKATGTTRTIRIRTI